MMELRSDACFLASRKAGILGLTLVRKAELISNFSKYRKSIQNMRDIYEYDRYLLAVDWIGKHKLNVFHGNSGRLI